MVKYIKLTELCISILLTEFNTITNKTKTIFELCYMRVKTSLLFGKNIQSLLTIDFQGNYRLRKQFQ